MSMKVQMYASWVFPTHGTQSIVFLTVEIMGYMNLEISHYGEIPSIGFLPSSSSTNACFF
jgi:hypothetical protein